MNPQHIHLMHKALRPVVKNQGKAKQILEGYWSDKVAVVWSIDQVHRAANECKRVLTNLQAQEILQQFFKLHNAQYGLTWEMLTQLIDQSILGRNISRKELRGFINKDKVFIEKKTI